MKNMIFIHGLESSGQGFKANFLREIFPYILTPDFPGSLDQRMKKLREVLDAKVNWIIIGSSFGGLMGSLYALKNPEKISLLILLAPLLVHPALNSITFSIDVPVIVFHGLNDNVVPLKETKKRAFELFSNLKCNDVDDDHFLRPTTTRLSWKELVSSSLQQSSIE